MKKFLLIVFIFFIITDVFANKEFSVNNDYYSTLDSLLTKLIQIDSTYQKEDVATFKDMLFAIYEIDNSFQPDNLDAIEFFFLEMIINDHLEPVYKHETLSNYDILLDTILLYGLSKTPIAQFKVLPSFSPAYILSVEKKSNKYKMIYKELFENWYSSNKKVKIKQITIDKEMSDAIQNIYKASILQTKKKHPKSDCIQVSDGVIHNFSTFDVNSGLISGQKNAPLSLKISELIEISELCIEYVKNGGPNNIKEEIINKSNALAIKIQNK